MFNFPSKEIVERLREQYPEGTRVRLLRMNDPYMHKLKVGELGTVRYVDDAGTIWVRWDCGSGLGVAYGEDLCEVVA